MCAAVRGLQRVKFGGLCVLAFSPGCEIGVDVEHIRPLADLQSIADQFFSVEEALELMSLSAYQRRLAFFLCWTRKEAYIKATGTGLSIPLSGVRVTLQPSQPARFIHVAHDATPASEWILHDLRLAPNYAAALAYRDAERPVTVLPILDPAHFLAI